MTKDRKETAQKSPDELIRALSSLDDQRQVQIAVIKRMQALSQGIFQMEIARLTRKFGKERPRVKAMEARLKDNLDRYLDIEVEGQLASTSVLRVGEDTALINGRVVDEKRRGFPGMKVAFETEDQKVVPLYGETETDANGYYALHVEPDKIMDQREVAPGGAYLTLRTKPGVLVHREEQPLTLVKGDRLYNEATLESGRPRPAGKTRKRPGGRKPAAQWVVRGRVVDEAGKAVAGVMVTAYDKDVKYDDVLGASLTDKKGKFEITFPTQEFFEGEEPGPDLYIRVVDSEGNLLYSTEEEIRVNATPEEVFEVTVKKPRSRRKGGAKRS